MENSEDRKFDQKALDDCDAKAKWELAGLLLQEHERKRSVPILPKSAVERYCAGDIFISSPGGLISLGAQMRAYYKNSKDFFTPDPTSGHPHKIDHPWINIPDRWLNSDEEVYVEFDYRYKNNAVAMLRPTKLKMNYGVPGTRGSGDYITVALSESLFLHRMGPGSMWVPRSVCAGVDDEYPLQRSKIQRLLLLFGFIEY